ncbi:MAG: amidohydrolase family protein [Desulfobulbaceae bacterium]|nr:amidohydrolase family protein [Desulfobulbaceae bacterium]
MNWKKKHSVEKSKLPLPTRICPEGETVAQQTAQMRRVERIFLEMTERYRAPLAMDRRSFLQSSCGLAAGFLAMNSVFGPLFTVNPAEAADPETGAARAREFADQLIFDVQTHFVYPQYPSTGILGLRELAKEWNPGIEGEQTPEKIRFDNFFKEVFLESETGLAVLSSAPNDDPDRYFLHNEAIAAAREKVKEKTGAKRLYTHALFTPGQPGWQEDMDRAISLQPDAWKGYTVGQPSGESKWPWRLDDEKLVYPAFEKMVKAGITTVCIHKGLLPSNYRQRMPSTWQYGNVDDVPKAAKDWPQLNFLMYHSAIKTGGIPAAGDLKRFEETGEISWVSELAWIPEKHGVNNVYAELGSVFAVTAVSAPRYCAGILGMLIKGMGEDRVLWGTDSVWYGSPQWQIEALRRLEMPEDLQKRFGYQTLGPADGPLKNRIFSGNAARVYPFAADSLQGDKLAAMKKTARAASG